MTKLYLSAASGQASNAAPPLDHGLPNTLHSIAAVAARAAGPVV